MQEHTDKLKHLQAGEVPVQGSYFWMLSVKNTRCFFGNGLFRCDSISRNTLHTGHSLRHYVTTSQSANYLLGQGSRSFRQSKDVKKGNIAIIAIPAIMTIIVSMTIAAITDIRAITASTGIRVN